MNLVKIDYSFKKIAAVLCLSSSIASGLIIPSKAAVSLDLAQAAPSSLNCRAERQQSQEALLGGFQMQAEQYITVGQLDQASLLLVQTLEAIKRMEDSADKVSLLERLVGSLGENVAYTSPLEQLVRAVPPQAPQAGLAAVSSAYDATQTLSTSYSASKTRTLTALANYATQLGQPDRSSSILGSAAIASRTIQGAELQAIAVTSIAEAYLNAEQTLTVTPFLDQALQLAQTINNPNPYRKAAVLGRIADLYARLGQLDRALEIVRSIQAPNYPGALIAVVNQYSEQGQVDRALELLQTLQQPEQKAILQAAIAGRLTAQQPERAAQLYTEAIAIARSVQDINPTIAQTALRYVETGGLIAAAEETIQAIDDPVFQTPALGSIALSYAKAGQEDQAETLLTQTIAGFNAISEESNRNLIRQNVIDQMMQNGRYDYALRIAETIQAGEETPFDRVDMLTRMADRAIADQRYDAALSVTQAIPPSFNDWRNRLFPQIARGFAQAGDFDRAQAIAEEQSLDPTFRPRILAVVAAQVLLVAGQIDPATALFNQAIELANAIEYPATRAETLAAIAIEYSRANQAADATQLLSQAIAAVQSIEDTSSRSYTLRTIAEQLTFNNQYGAAIQVASAIPEDAERIAKLSEAIEKAVNTGDFPAAIAVLDQLNSPVLKTRWLVTIADRYMQLGDRTQAANSLSQAFQTAQTIPGAESLTVNVRGGENPLVGEDDQDRGSFLEAIALKYAQIGEVAQALQVAQRLENRTVRQQLIQRIGCYR